MRPWAPGRTAPGACLKRKSAATHRVYSAVVFFVTYRVEGTEQPKVDGQAGGAGGAGDGRCGARDERRFRFEQSCGHLQTSYIFQRINCSARMFKFYLQVCHNHIKISYFLFFYLILPLK